MYGIMSYDQKSMEGIGSCNVSKLVRKTKDIILFFFNDTATSEIYTLSLHDALPI